jgi:integrase
MATPFKLTPQNIGKAPPGRHLDAAGLYLQVTARGGRSWIYRFMFNGTPREMGLGSAGNITIAAARALRDEAYRQRVQGLDPVAARHETRRLAKLEADRMTFRQVAESYIAERESGWSNDKHKQQWRYTLSAFAYPEIGDLPIDTIERKHVLDVLRPIWKTKNETAARVRGRLERIFAYAAANDLRKAENPADWRLLRDALGKRDHKVEHHAALPFEQMPEFMSELRKREGLASRALEFVILTAARAGEALGATWGEIDLEKYTWTVPAERMKSRKEHRVPLSDAAFRVLRTIQLDQEEAAKRSGLHGSTIAGALIFPGLRKKPLTDAALAAVIARMTADRVKAKGKPWPACTTHGMRSTFSTWASEEAHVDSDVIEAALAHTIENKVKRAYKRGDLLDRRKPLMAAWAGYIEHGAPRGKVIPLRAG